MAPAGGLYQGPAKDDASGLGQVLWDVGPFRRTFRGGK